MKKITLCSMTLLCAACSSHREAASHTAARVDSMASSRQHYAIAAFDTMTRNVELSFDTLKISIRQTPENAETPMLV